MPNVLNVTKVIQVNFTGSDLVLHLTLSRLKFVWSKKHLNISVPNNLNVVRMLQSEVGRVYLQPASKRFRSDDM